MLPNGPTLALAVMAIANRYTMIPMARTVAPEQLRADLEDVDADAILMLESDVSKIQLDSQLPIFVVNPQADLTFTVSSTRPIARSTLPPPDNSPDDVAVLLFTSGTSGKKKLVPITVYNLFAGAVLTMDSVALTESSRCLNMMPLHHMYVSSFLPIV
jgi:long-subunit acyl-CoA synthetase (AMP-forming)